MRRLFIRGMLIIHRDIVAIVKHKFKQKNKLRENVRRLSGKKNLVRVAVLQSNIMLTGIAFQNFVRIVLLKKRLSGKRKNARSAWRLSNITLIGKRSQSCARTVLLRKKLSGA